MNYKTKKLFELLNIKPNEIFKVNEDDDLVYKISENLKIYVKDSIVDWTLIYWDIKDFILDNIKTIQLPNPNEQWTAEKNIVEKYYYNLLNTKKIVKEKTEFGYVLKYNSDRHADLWKKLGQIYEQLLHTF